MILLNSIPEDQRFYLETHLCGHERNPDCFLSTSNNISFKNITTYDFPLIIRNFDYCDPRMRRLAQLPARHFQRKQIAFENCRFEEVKFDMISDIRITNCNACFSFTATFTDGSDLEAQRYAISHDLSLAEPPYESRRNWTYTRTGSAVEVNSNNNDHARKKAESVDGVFELDLPYLGGPSATLVVNNFTNW
eukprot:TRINITY_DN2329_c0_g2_i2.p1 TRINITY_DN2329_c0_g2~~TRINITY_DN2329_c0_g2_i2.p1  ORF type:complete len:192 (-),score=4.63 TRINITY_DN2329_c0_g2_i2:90-665(-)